MLRTVLFLAALFLAAISYPLAASADWTLAPEQSKIAFGSIKNDTVGESHHFSGLSGSVSDDGAVVIDIDLGTAETHIDIRNERMQNTVFQGVEPAQLTAKVDMEALGALSPGESTTMSIPGTLQFGSRSLDLDIPVFIARLTQTRVVVSTDEMLFVTSEEMGTDAGLDALKEIAGLDAITRTSPVTFRFVFDEVQ